MKIKNCLRAGERKSIARFRQHFGGPRLMAALAYRALSLIVPVAVLALLGLGIAHFAGNHGLMMAAVGAGVGGGKFLEVMDYEEAVATSARDRASHIGNFEERLAGFMKGFMNWRPSKRLAFLEEAGAETITDFLVLFSNVIDRMLLPKYKMQTPDYRNYVKVGASRDFRKSQGIGTWGLRGAFDARTLRGEYKERVLNDGKVEIQVAAFGNRFSIGWENFINDDLGALSDVADDFVQAALATELREASKLIAGAAGPNAALFGNAVTHPIDATTIDNTDILAFSLDNLGTVITRMSSQVDADGNPILVSKFHIVYPPALEIPVLKALSPSQLLAVGVGNSAAVTASENVIQKNFSITPHKNAWLPILDKSGSADKTWYVFADPAADGPAAQLNFLRGRETPEVLMKASNKVALGGAAVSAMEGDIETDKVVFRGRHIMGGAAVDPRYAYVNVGP
jgi:hypothetical protein